jgi:carbamoyl-phosphate synthase large subunit
MAAKKLTVAVTGMNANPPNPGPGVAVARCLRQAADRVGRIIGLGYDALEPGFYLPQYTNASYLIPFPSDGEDALLKRLSDIQQTEAIDVLIPCLDAELLGVIRIGDALKKIGIATLLPTEEQLKIRNKDRLSEWAKMGRLKTPETIVVARADFFYHCHQKGWYYPMVVKGLFYEAAIAQSPDQASEIFQRISARWGLPILVQRFVVGEEINLTAIGDGTGKMLGPVMMKKRATTNEGKAWAGVTIKDDHFTRAASAIFKKLRWTGPLELEIMRDQQGTYQLIEINPRFPSWVYLASGVGRNLPLALVELALGQKLPRFSKISPGVMFVRHVEDQIVPIEAFESMIIKGFHA